MVDVTQSCHFSRQYIVLCLLCILLPAAVFADPLSARRVHWPPHADQQPNRSQLDGRINTIPVNGLTPLVVQVLTDARLGDSDLVHMLEPSLTGAVLTGTAETTYAIGRFDTGSVAHLTGFCEAEALGLTGPFLTANTIPITGFSGVVEPLISQPIGVFVDGLQAIDPATGLLDSAGVLGHSNVAILAGTREDCTDGSELPTAIGTPLSAFYTTVIRNDQPISLQLGNILYTTPVVEFYTPGDDQIPTYPFRVPLELQPPAFDAAYLSSFTPDTFEVGPITPTTLIGTRIGAHFFARVHLSHGLQTVTQQSFLVDTGSQISVISSVTASLLGVNPQRPDFIVDVEGLGGTIPNVPGFIIDTLEIVALGNSLTLPAVAVVMFDIPSSQGGVLSGIIGTNLFADRNLVFAGDLVAPFMEISEPIMPN